MFVVEYETEEVLFKNIMFKWVFALVKKNINVVRCNKSTVGSIQVMIGQRLLIESCKQKISKFKQRNKKLIMNIEY